jgi:hypothetical protein
LGCNSTDFAVYETVNVNFVAKAPGQIVQGDSLAANTRLAQPNAMRSRGEVVVDNDSVANVSHTGNVARGLGGGNFLILGRDSTAEKSCAIDYRNFNSSYRMLSDGPVYVEF